jgi:hypothetical protein
MVVVLKSVHAAAGTRRRRHGVSRKIVNDGARIARVHVELAQTCAIDFMAVA